MPQPETCSKQGDVQTSLTFINRADEPADIYWIDYDCQLQHYKTLQVGESWTVSTWATHAWQVVGAISQQFLARAIASERAHEVPILKRGRSTQDRPDERTGFQIQPLYVLPSDGEDHYLDTNGTLSTSIKAWNHWLAEQTNGFKLRIDTFNGQADIVFVRLNASAAEVAANTQLIREELQQRGFNQPNKIYAIYYDGANKICGDSQKMHNIGTVYLQGELCPGELFTSDPKTPGYWEFVMLHELLHALGCVPDCAPNMSKERPAHVDDHPQDIMYYRTATHPLILDAGRDDYYGHGRPDCYDLARSPFLEPIPDQSVLPVTWRAHLIRQQLLAQPDLLNLRTESSGPQMTLTIENQTSEELFLFFIHEDGRVTFYDHLYPNTIHQQHTYDQHAWALVTFDEERAEIVRWFRADLDDSSVVLS